MAKKGGGCLFWRYFLVILFLVFFLFPVYWIVAMSLKSRVEAISIPPIWFFKPKIGNYFKVLESPFSRAMINSLIVSSCSVLLSILIGTPAAYALARFQFKHKSDLLFWILSTRMAPYIAVGIPFFLIFRNLGMLDTHIALIIVYLTFNLSFVIWLMRSFFMEIPQELEEAALVDGSTELGAFLKISMPLAIPGLVASTILSFIFSWNEFFFALILTRRTAQTVPVAISSYIGFMGIRWEEMAAAAVIASLPIIILALLVHKHLVRGLTMGAIK